ncbi:nitrous oxide reductase accessory protein NosL [Bacillus sp. FJAT-29790]|uniref:nitrous oxide reductase accessory protein NosL n=1 Tax=Bacillus sp. FJAT-29790 TaxID=1895002 RepID=UPI001C243516|nr:nitrous oxide reductase accessory protein NosL [Bacillus sp. FJAT-29790]MBU8878315.1 nitrous oxide reductase accessory protein NosL [Bacillus sp. FJAT-29790]
MKLKWLALIAAVVFSLTGCSAAASGPVDIQKNQENCDSCNMGIMDLDSAAQIVLKNGKPLLFDDIGCMIEYLQENNPQYEGAFVHDFDTKKWIDLDSSVFIQDQKIESPMSYGIAAFSTSEGAKEFQNEHGGHLYSKKDMLEVDLKNFKQSGSDHSH